MTIAAAIATTGLAFSPRTDRALSNEARVLRAMLDEVSVFPRSIAVGEPKRSAQDALQEAYQAAQVEDWDGEGAPRVEPNTYYFADQFLRLLPTTIPNPEIVADRDGEILIEWDLGRRRVFTVSVGRDGTLSFSGLFGHRKIHGTEHLGELLPLAISDALQRLVTSARR